MRTTNGINSSYLFFFWFFSYDIKKEKAKLTHWFLLFVPIPAIVPLHTVWFIYLYILDRKDKDRTELFVL